MGLPFCHRGERVAKMAMLSLACHFVGTNGRATRGKYLVLLRHPCSHASLKSEPSNLDLTIKRHMRWEGLNTKLI
jgi:hypothetical protein